MSRLFEVYNYRQMLLSMIRTDLRTRYKGSFLGFLWTFVNPLLQLLVYTLIFTQILKTQIPKYPVYLFVGLLSWTLFQTAVQTGTGIVNRQANLVKKIYFPREILPLAIVGGAAVNYILSLLVLVPFILLEHVPLSWPLVYLPVVLLAQIFVSLGFAFVFSALNVFFRDLEHIIGIFMMLWFYCTPIVYKLSAIPPKDQIWLEWNPMTPITVAYQRIFYQSASPGVTNLLLVLLEGVLMTAVGWIVYYRLSRRFAEEI